MLCLGGLGSLNNGGCGTVSLVTAGEEKCGFVAPGSRAGSSPCCPGAGEAMEEADGGG